MAKYPLTISEVEWLPVKPRGGLIGFASCIANNQLFIGNIAVYTRPDGSGIRLVYPSKTLPNGLTISCVHPICREAGQAITEAVAGKMNEMASRRGGFDLNQGQSSHLTHGKDRKRS